MSGVGVFELALARHTTNGGGVCGKPGYGDPGFAVLAQTEIHIVEPQTGRIQGLQGAYLVFQSRCGKIAQCHRQGFVGAIAGSAAEYLGKLGLAAVFQCGLHGLDQFAALFFQSGTDRRAFLFGQMAHDCAFLWVARDALIIGPETVRYKLNLFARPIQDAQSRK